MNAAQPVWVAVHARWHSGVLLIAALALVACAIAAITDTTVVLRSYSLAWLFALSLSLGSLAALMLYHLTGGGWGVPVRRFFEAAVAQIPLLAVLLIPLVIGTSRVFDLDAIAPAKRWYLNEPFFLARNAVYLVAWIVLALIFERSARRERRVPGVSAVGLLVYGLTMTFAAIDWIGALTPRWSSTALGMIVITGQGLGAFAFAVSSAAGMELALKLRRASAPYDSQHAPIELTAQRANDLGNLLLAFVMTWMYLTYAQFLIIWAEDLPRETVWYLSRSQGIWPTIAVALVIGEFAIPFSLLLFRRVKRDPRILLFVAFLALAAHWLDVAWLVLPSSSEAFHWTDFAASLGVGGLWLYAFLRHLAARPSFAHAAFTAEAQHG